ncbi:hypothetical protein HPB47_012638 [Ixodes persulcatus]|uniref:Uncharacterized protein n=1 Tax=Ixodes persulcatus TaxID=34615 RepID=A0AC60NSZ5_IXOPE|nr:hypothetical protein HPB47_012638 [Ixodes persulcatus]
MRTELNKERKKLEEAWQGQLEEVKVMQRSNKDKHEAIEWQLEARLTKEKEGQEAVERELERLGREQQQMKRWGTEGRACGGKGSEAVVQYGGATEDPYSNSYPTCNAGKTKGKRAESVGGRDRQRSRGRAKVAALPGRGMKEVMGTAVEMFTVNKGDENLVVVHAGLNDVLGRRGRGLATHIEDGVKQGRGVGTECAVQEVNRTMKRLSSKNGYEVMNVNRELYQENGLHYGELRVKRVGRRMGGIAKALLGAPTALR